MDLFSNKQEKDVNDEWSNFLTDKQDLDDINQNSIVNGYASFSVLDKKMTLNEGIKRLEPEFRLLEKARCSTNESEDVYSVLMYRDSTGDIFYTNALEDNFYYKNSCISAIRLEAHYSGNVLPSLLTFKEQFQQSVANRKMEGMQYLLINDDNLLLTKYDQLNQGLIMSKVKEIPIDLKQITYLLSNGGIIPKYVIADLDSLVHKIKNNIDEYAFYVLDEQGYLLNNYINYFKFMHTLSENHAKWCVNVYSYLHNHRFSLFCKYAGILSFSAEEIALLLRLAFAYCEKDFQITRDEMHGYVSEILNTFSNERRSTAKLTWEDRKRNCALDFTQIYGITWYPDTESRRIIDLILPCKNNGGVDY